MYLSPFPTRRKEDLFRVLADCRSDAPARQTFYDSCKRRYLSGGTPLDSARVNKIGPFVEKKAALLYSPDSLRFWVNVPPDEESQESFHQTDPVADFLAEAWADTDSDVLFSEAVTWSLVNGASILTFIPELKTNGEVNIVTHLIDNPADFGVWRPGQTDLRRQQAMSLTTYWTLAELEIRLRHHPMGPKVLYELATHKPNQDSGGGVIEMGPSATVYKADWNAARSYSYQAQYPQTYYQLHDLYYFDDDRGDWMVATISGSCVLYDRPIEVVGLPGTPPFIKVCPNNIPGYFWGKSMVEDLAKLQQWYSARLEDMDDLFAKMLRPPKAAYGMGQGFEGKLASLNRPGGKAAFPSMNSKVEEFKSMMSPEMFEMMSGIDVNFSSASNMEDLLQGKMPGGAKGEAGMGIAKRLGGAVISRQALAIEKQVEDAAGLLLKLLARYHADPLMDDNNKPFYLAQFAPNFTVKVDGRSSSPLNMDDTRQDALVLKKFGAITNTDLIDMMHPAQANKFKRQQKKIQWIEMLAQKVVEIQQQQKRSGKAA
jgi:hypothetical protein